MNTFKDWIRNQYERDELKDICEHGCVPGVHGVTYYSETCALYDEHKDEIWDKLNADYESLGYKTVHEMIASFNGAKNARSDEQFKNLLVWYYVEEIAREILGY